MKHRNWFWGLFFLLAAVFVLASPFGIFSTIGPMTVLATVLLAALAVESGANRNYFGLFLSLALIYAVNQQPLHLFHISFWLLVLAAVFAAIGCGMLFPHPYKSPPCGWQGAGGGPGFPGPGQTRDDNNNPAASVSFGSACRYLHGDCLRSARFSVAFGRLDVFFDQAKLSPDGADVFISCSFSGMELYIPKEWRVVDDLRMSGGTVEDPVRPVPPAPDAPRLTLSGNVSFGKVALHYI